MRLVFFGSDDFAAVHLKSLLASPHSVVACVTQPDKPQGRGMKVAVALIKQIAIEQNIPYLQPATLKEAGVAQALQSYQADIFVVVAYGRLLTQQVLDIPKIFCVNVHGSLLPKYRGAAPINWAILNNEKKTGVSVQKMALALDAGDVLAQEITAIGPQQDAMQLRSHMADVGAELLVKVLNQIQEGSHHLVKQDESQVSYAPKLTKDMGRIDWAKPSRHIDLQVRALKPWPGTYTSYNEKIIKIIEAEPVALDSRAAAPGQVVSFQAQGFVVATGKGGLLIKQLQPEAGKVMSAAAFVAGYRLTLSANFK